MRIDGKKVTLRSADQLGSWGNNLGAGKSWTRVAVVGFQKNKEDLVIDS